MDGNGKKAYFTSWPLIVFIFNMPTSKGFISLVPILKIFRALNWKIFPTVKLINNYNIKILVKYKKLGAAKHSFFLDSIITGFKECFFLIVKTLIMYKIGEDWWFNGRIINKLPLVIY